jgi:hypothetical protein
MTSNATAELHVVSGEGLNLRRSPARAESGRRSGAPSGSIVVIVVVVGAKPTRLRVDCHFARLPIHGSGHIDISAVVEMTTFDHPSVCNFSNTCSAVTGRSPAMKAGPGACCAFAIIRPTLPASNAPPIACAMSRFISLAFAVQVHRRAEQSGPHLRQN